eukprot:CFRG0295T1
MVGPLTIHHFSLANIINFYQLDYANQVFSHSAVGDVSRLKGSLNCDQAYQLVSEKDLRRTLDVAAVRKAETGNRYLYVLHKATADMLSELREKKRELSIEIQQSASVIEQEVDKQVKILLKEYEEQLSNLELAREGLWAELIDYRTQIGQHEAKLEQTKASFETKTRAVGQVEQRTQELKYALSAKEHELSTLQAEGAKNKKRLTELTRALDIDPKNSVHANRHLNKRDLAAQEEMREEIARLTLEKKYEPPIAELQNSLSQDLQKEKLELEAQLREMDQDVAPQNQGRLDKSKGRFYRLAGETSAKADTLLHLLELILDHPQPFSEQNIEEAFPSTMERQHQARSCLEYLCQSGIIALSSTGYVYVDSNEYNKAS